VPLSQQEADRGRGGSDVFAAARTRGTRPSSRPSHGQAETVALAN
jgi:hypothetical protein